jgi:hypothetical protein
MATVHWHIKTTHKEGSPEYPNKGAVFLYHMACGLITVSNKQFKGVKHTQFKKDEVNCPLCLIKITGKIRIQ